MNINKSLILLVSILAFNVNAKISSKVFTSYEAQYDASIIITPTEKSEIYYIKFVGFENKYDGDVLLYTKNKTHDGYDYKLLGMPTIINVKDNQHRTSRNGSWTPYLEVFLGDDSVTRVIYSGTIDIVKERKIKQQYLDRQLTVISKVAAKKLITKAQQEFITSCAVSVDVDINWSAFKEDKVTPAKTAAYLNSLSKICTIDSDYSNAVKSIQKITVTPSESSTQHQAQLVGNELTLNIGKNVPNLPETSFALLFEIF